MSKKLIQSYVWHGDKCFFVSTIDRESSAALAYGGMYAETMVWAYDYAKGERGNFKGQAEGVEGSIRTHLMMCERLHKIGCTDEPDDGAYRRVEGHPDSGLSLLNDGLCVTNHPSFMPLQKDVDKAQFCNYTASTLTKRSKYHDRNQPHPSRIE